MVGIPPTVGFVAKWYLAVGAVEAGAWPVLVVILVSTLLSLTYFGRIVERLYASEGPDRREPDRGRVSTGMRGVAVGAAVATVALGLAGIAIASLVEPTVVPLLEP